ncbi:MAG: HAMP domain-containing histidine kinase, partial [Halobacteriales archaeon]|nr:HAMP domain-containing histidine kinase [Halobacteriales archaeon]
AESFQESAHERGVTLTVRASGPVPVEADHERLAQVLSNLLTNALKFTPAGGAVTLRVGAGPGGGAEVAVEDSGRGLTADEAARLFQPFSQVHDPGEVKEPGTGLGLYICKGIVEAHGGRIQVKSAGRAHGSTFTFELPARPPPDLPATPRGS